MQFVFVHGSFHGAWCWEHLIPLLDRRGHHVMAPNLVTDQKDTAGQSIDHASNTGCSMGGIVSSQVAERRPHRLAAVVYINGLLFRSDEGLVSFLDEHAHLGVEDLVLKNMKISEDGVTATFPQEAAAEVFYTPRRPNSPPGRPHVCGRSVCRSITIRWR
jgi:pimeloyl-ACP methyl ester carboxylesterase